MRRLAVVLATLAALSAAAHRPAAAAPAAVTYRPPVDAPVVDGFRPPPENWNAGNRGLEYATPAGTPVRASGAGEVVFAGPVAGGLHVVVLHDDGLRTSYSFLSTVSVRRGDKVRQGQAVGTSRDRLHFGVRAGDAYLDPAKLFGDGAPEVHLVPDELRRPQTEAHERAGLARMLQGWATRAVDGGAAALAWAKDRTGKAVADRLDEASGVLQLAREARPLTHAGRLAGAASEWWRTRGACTPATVAPPGLHERRVLVTVAGLGSSSRGSSLDALDTAALGYADADVLRFSYRGGTTAERSYAATDTTDDIRHSAARLRELLARVEAEHPGVPIDVIAHSQGGVVARSALTDEFDGADPRLPAVRSLITLSSPHLGAPLATGVTMAGHTTVGEALEAELHRALPHMVDPRGRSVTQLAEESTFLRRLNARPLPAGINATSIAAREDWMVPAGATRLAGARNVTVSAPGHLTEHSAMPGGPQTQREIALAVAGMAPTCQSFGDAMADVVVSDAIRWVENGTGGGAWLLGRRLDRKLDATIGQAADRLPLPAPAPGPTPAPRVPR